MEAVLMSVFIVPDILLRGPNCPKKSSVCTSTEGQILPKFDFRYNSEFLIARKNSPWLLLKIV